MLRAALAATPPPSFMRKARPKPPTADNHRSNLSARGMSGSTPTPTARARLRLVPDAPVMSPVLTVAPMSATSGGRMPHEERDGAPVPAPVPSDHDQPFNLRRDAMCHGIAAEG